jgi:LmbE family N-acetylglucosaminyl deacetylase
MIYSQDDVKKLGSILGIWAHPDDESWSSAGLMKMAVLNGQKLGIITATYGDAGETADEKKWPKKDLSKIRKKELENCLCFVGQVEQFWLDYEDGKMANEDTEVAVGAIVRILKVFKPQTVITFESNGITGHDDHKTISKWTSLAVKKSGLNITLLHVIESREKFELAGNELDREFNIFFNIEKPFLIEENDADILLKLSPEILECKIRCIQSHASQSSHIFSIQKGIDAVTIMSETECYIKVRK